jgi:hypothetical protein
MNFLLAQTASNPPEQIKPDTITEWGVWGAIAFFLVKEAASWFNKKEDSEAKLLSDLIKNQQIWSDRLNEKYETTLLTMRDSQLKTHQSLIRIEASVSEMAKLHYKEVRQSSLNLMALREEMNALNATTTELLRRSDKLIGINANVRKLPPLDAQKTSS